jgi:hypothetical protein
VVDLEGQHSNQEQTTTTDFVGGCDANNLVDRAGQHYNTADWDDNTLLELTAELQRLSRPLKRLVKLWKAGTAAWTPAQRRPSPASSIVRRQPKVRQRRLSPKQVQELINAYGRGIPANELAAQFQVHRDTVFEHLKRQQVRRRRPPLDRVQIEEALDLYRGGMSAAALAAYFEVHPSTILRTLHREGVPVRDCHGRA